MGQLLRTLSASLTGLVLVAAVEAQTVYVDANLTTGANDGSSWADAHQGSDGLRAALASAVDGSRIWLTAGTYIPSASGLRAGRFLVTGDMLTVMGGFAGGEVTPFERPEPGTGFRTVLSGDLLGNDDGSAASLADNSFNVLTLDQTRETELDRIEVTGANPVGFGGFLPFEGALALRECFNARIQGCVISGNAGGGVYAEGPRAGLFIADCEMSRNGGIGFHVASSILGAVRMDRCRVEDNGQSGARWSGNWSNATTVENSLFARNGGSGIFFAPNPESTLPGSIRGCTMVQNGRYGFEQQSSQSFPIGPDVVSCILWQNANAAQFFGPGDLRWSIVQGAPLGGTNLNGSDPRFVDLAAGDYRLLADSPAIDSAESVLADLEALDLVRGRRGVDIKSRPDVGSGPFGFLDRGAFEFTADLGVIECVAQPNSTGRTGRIAAEGSLVAADNNVTLRADRLPPNQFGIFLASRQAGRVPMAGGPGTLCLGGDIGRFTGPGQVLFSGAGGFSLAIDLTSLPQPSALVGALPGETWRFQAWHRDAGSPPNFTDAVALRFE